MLTIDEALELMRQHSVANPTHGIDCACKDQATREVRQGMTKGKMRELQVLFRRLNHDLSYFPE